jgi:glutamyl-Q tRNA(Asp) synthetase
LLDDLDWLGLEPDGPGTSAFRAGPLAQRQSDEPMRYAVRLAALEARGLAYACRCSRADIARASTGDGDPRYPGTCRDAAIDASSTPARRVVMVADAVEHFDDLLLGPQAQDPDRQCGDVLARDRAGNWTYQFAVVVDDLEQGVDLIIRGVDLLDSTGRQRRLARLLGRQEAPRVLHHPRSSGIRMDAS